MVREMLSPDRLRRSGIFNPEFVRAVLKAAAAPAPPLALLPALADDRRRDLARDVRSRASLCQLGRPPPSKERDVMKPEPGSTVDDGPDFWQSHINNEYYTDADASLGRVLRGDRGAPVRARTTTCPSSSSRWPAADEKLLEVGCGIGVDSIQLAKRGLRGDRGRPDRERACGGQAVRRAPRGHDRLPARATPRGSTSPTRASTPSTRSACSTTPPTSNGPSRRCTGSCGRAERRT